MSGAVGSTPGVRRTVARILYGLVVTGSISFIVTVSFPMSGASSEVAVQLAVPVTFSPNTFGVSVTPTLVAVQLPANGVCGTAGVFINAVPSDSALVAVCESATG